MCEKTRSFVMTLDLETDFCGGLCEEYQILQSPEKIKSLLEFLQSRDVRLSVFVVGELLEKFPQIIELFMEYGCEFHCHSYSHDAQATDSEEEIEKCKQAYEKFFHAPPLGYRAPDGRISTQGIQNLEKFGFKFDSSIFPSYYPNPCKYLFRNKDIHLYKGSNILEIPNTPISPFRLMLSISYIKFLGFKNFHRILKLSQLPQVVIFGSHLHDFFSEEDAVRRMSWLWRFVYGRNRDQGVEYLDQTLGFFREKGYSFRFISEIYREYHTKLQT